jgi:glutamate dehydrogenase/leucine dehydrogenase
LTPGELNNAGGVEMSIQENRRDLDMIAQGHLYLPVSDDTYEDRLFYAMSTKTHRVHNVAEEYGLNLVQATRAVGLANHAMAHGMPVDDRMSKLLLV